MRDANINAVRVHAHVASQAFYDQADESGMLVWQDMPLQWGMTTAPPLHMRLRVRLKIYCSNGEIIRQ